MSCMSAKVIFCGRSGMPHHSADQARREAASVRVGAGSNETGNKDSQKGHSEILNSLTGKNTVDGGMQRRNSLVNPP